VVKYVCHKFFVCKGCFVIDGHLVMGCSTLPLPHQKIGSALECKCIRSFPFENFISLYKVCVYDESNRYILIKSSFKCDQEIMFK
jgi:hypothetical protein